eukprot:1954017-Alexandrium_andersonii.AAC.1
MGTSQKRPKIVTPQGGRLAAFFFAPCLVADAATGDFVPSAACAVGIPAGEYPVSPPAGGVGISAGESPVSPLA